MVTVYAPAWTTVVVCAGAHHHLVHPHGKEACVKLRAYHNTHYVPVHNKAVNPPHGKEACVKTRASHNTHYVPVHNIAFDEKPAYGGDTHHR